MNKKFWMLIVTGAVLAAGVTATGCAAQRRIDPTIAPTGTAIETTAEAETQPSQEETAPAGQKILVNENAFADENTTGNQAETDDGEKIAIPPFKTTKKAAKKTPAKTVTKTSKKTSKKSTVDPRALIVKTARAQAEQNAKIYQNMNEKIALAKQEAAKKTAAQKNAEARKNMNKAAEDAQNAAKIEQGKQYVKRVTQKADARIGAEKAAEAAKIEAEAQKAAKEEQGKQYVKHLAQKADARIGAQKAAEAAKKDAEAKKIAARKAAKAKKVAEKQAEKAKKEAEKKAAKAKKEAAKKAAKAKKEAAKKAAQKASDRAKKRNDSKMKKYIKALAKRRLTSRSKNHRHDGSHFRTEARRYSGYRLEI